MPQITYPDKAISDLYRAVEANEVKAVVNAKMDRPNGLVSGGAITIGSHGGAGTNNDIKVAAGSYFISPNFYNFTETPNTAPWLDVALCAGGFSRYVEIVGTTTGITRRDGTPSAIPSHPTLAANEISIGWILVGDSVFEETASGGGASIISDNEFVLDKTWSSSNISKNLHTYRSIEFIATEEQDTNSPIIQGITATTGELALFTAQLIPSENGEYFYQSGAGWIKTAAWFDYRANDHYYNESLFLRNTAFYALKGTEVGSLYVMNVNEPSYAFSKIGGRVVTTTVSSFQALNGIYQPSTTYVITDADVNLYGGNEIYLTTNNKGKLNERGIGKFFNPKYDQTVAGFNVWTNLSSFVATPTSGTWTPQYPPENITANNGATGRLFTTISGTKFIALSDDWSTATSITGDTTGATATIASVVLKSYTDGDLVHWGGKTWERDGTVTNGIVGTASDIRTLSADWIEIPFDEIEYNVAYDEIKYDVENDLIVYRNEKNSNVVSTNKGFNDYEGWNPIKDFMWGNVYSEPNYKGIGSQTITNSYNGNINFRGSYQYYLTFENNSYQLYLTFDNNSNQQYLTFDNSSYQENLTFENNSTQYNLTFDNSYQQYLTFDNSSYQENLTFENYSTQFNLTFDNSSYQENLTFENYSYQNNLTFDNNSYQQNLTFENNSSQQYLTEITGKNQNRISFNNYYYDRTSLPMLANETYLEFKGNLPTITSLNNTTDKIYVKQGNQVKEITTDDLAALIGGGGGSGTSLTDTITAGENLAAKDLVYLKSDGKYWKADYTTIATCTTELRLVTATILANATGESLSQGILAGFTGLTAGAEYFVGANGAICLYADIPDTEGIIVRSIGTAKSSTELEFNPDATWIKTTQSPTFQTGIVRLIETRAGVTATLGANAMTEYVENCTGTNTLTLPTAVGNTNKYTVTVISGATTVNTTSAQTINGSGSIVMSTAYLSYDFISNGSNWILR